MKVKDLRTILERIQGVYSAGGAKSQASDLEKIVETLDGHEDSTVDKFVDETLRLLNEPVQRPAKPPLQINQVAIERHVKRLEEAGTDRASFDEAFGELSKDKSVKKKELFEITICYYGSVPKSFTKDQLLDKIEKGFLERAQFAGKQRVIDKITPW